MRRPLLLGLTSIVAMFGFALPAFAEAPAKAPEAASDWGFAVEAAPRFGPVDGFLQVPKGGRPGTATHERPTFADLGFHDLLVVEVAAAVEHSGHSLRLATGILANGESDATVSDPFIYHAQTFGRGERIRSSLDLSTYEATYGHALRPAEGLVLTPIIGLGFLDFSLEIAGAGGESTSRSVQPVYPRFGIDLRYAVTDAASLELRVVGDPPPLTIVLTADLLLRYRVAGDADGLGLSLFAGTGFDYIDFEDSQTLPNHLVAFSGPLAVGGIEIGF